MSDIWNDGKRFSRGGHGERVPSPPRVEAFLDEYEALCRKYGLALSHEDGYGSFIIEDEVEHNVDWARAASIDIDDIQQEKM